MKYTDRGPYIASLDGLRCLAILPVFLSHAQMAADVPRFIPGNFGVTLFFFLSGYLITTLMRLEMDRTGTVNFRLFYVRRALRIFPTFYLVLALAAAYGWYSGLMDPLWLLGQIMHVTNFQIIYGGWGSPIAPHTDVYWSLAVEEHFYLIFPLVFASVAQFGSRFQRAAIMISICVLVFFWRCWLIFVLDVSFDRTYLGTDTRIGSILFGCALALWGNPALDPSRISESTWKHVLFPLSVIGILITFAVEFGFGGRAFRETFGYTIQGICLIAVFIAAIRYPDWGPMRILNYRWARWFGALSYAIYLIHPSILAICRELFGSSFLIILLTAGPITVAAAAALRYGVESPMGRIRKRMSVLANPELAAKDG